MNAVMHAGGMGIRLSDEMNMRSKPMVEMGGKPILRHSMKIYAVHGINEFVIAVGYKSEVIKEYFQNCYAINSDISGDLETGKTTIHDGKRTEEVHQGETGLHTQTGVD